MSPPISLKVTRGRAHLNELGPCQVPATEDLAQPGVLLSLGRKTCLPAFVPAAQQAGGQEAFGTSLTADGLLTVVLNAVVPAGIAGADGATPLLDDVSFELVLGANSGYRSLPLQVRREGTLCTLTVQLQGADLDRARPALFDAQPDITVRARQPVKLAVRQTSSFIQRYWSDDTIRKGLLDQFGGIPFDAASTYFQLASGGDPDFPNQYLLLDCVYAISTPVPPLPGYVQWQVTWNGRAYNYYQDNRERRRVFYLPDRFELAKGPTGAATISLLQFSGIDDQKPLTDARALFRTFGSPVIDQARLANAAQALRERVGGVPEMVCLEDGHGVKKTFTQYLPNAQASSEAGNAVVQADAAINLVTGLRNELNLNFNQFRALWAAIFSSAPERTLFRGWVDVELADGRYKDRIEFTGRLPADLQTGFLDDILDTSSTDTYPFKLAIQTVPKVFDGQPAVLEIGLTFPGATSTLDAQHLHDDVVIQRSLRDIVLGNQPPDMCPYRMRVVRQDAASCRNAQVGTGEAKLWILGADVQACTGPCA